MNYQEILGKWWTCKDLICQHYGMMQVCNGWMFSPAIEKFNALFTLIWKLLVSCQQPCIFWLFGVWDLSMIQSVSFVLPKKKCHLCQDAIKDVSLCQSFHGTNRSTHIYLTDMQILNVLCTVQKYAMVRKLEHPNRETSTAVCHQTLHFLTTHKW
jgi:hypothetical protein